MKADHNGTRTEQARARMGWRSLSERKAAGPIDTKACCNCQFFWAKESPSRDGAVVGNFSFYCGNPRAAGDLGHATRGSATCDFWKSKSL